MELKNNSNKEKLYIYSDLISQPVRSVLSFCNVNDIKYEIINTYISKLQNRDEEYLKKVNPHGKVPAIKLIETDGSEFYLYESTAIMRFLAFRYNVDEKWYNKKDIYRRAKIDQYLDFHHENTRRVLAGIFYHRFTLPMLKKLGFKPKIIIPDQEKNLPEFLAYINSILSKQKYIVDDEISIGDLMLFHELIQLFVLGIDYKEYSSIVDYIEKIKKIEGVFKTTNVLKLVAEKNNKNIKF